MAPGHIGIVDANVFSAYVATDQQVTIERDRLVGRSLKGCEGDRVNADLKDQGDAGPAPAGMAAQDPAPGVMPLDRGAVRAMAARQVGTAAWLDSDLRLSQDEVEAAPIAVPTSCLSQLAAPGARPRPAEGPSCRRGL